MSSYYGIRYSPQHPEYPHEIPNDTIEIIRQTVSETALQLTLADSIQEQQKKLEEQQKKLEEQQKKLEEKGQSKGLIIVTCT